MVRVAAIVMAAKPDPDGPEDVGALQSLDAPSLFSGTNSGRLAAAIRKRAANDLARERLWQSTC